MTVHQCGAYSRNLLDKCKAPVSPGLMGTGWGRGSGSMVNHIFHISSTKHTVPFNITESIGKNIFLIIGTAQMSSISWYKIQKSLKAIME